MRAIICDICGDILADPIAVRIDVMPNDFNPKLQIHRVYDLCKPCLLKRELFVLIGHGDVRKVGRFESEEKG